MATTKARKGQAGATVVRFILIAVVPLLAIKRQFHKQQKSSIHINADDNEGFLSNLVSNLKYTLSSVTSASSLFSTMTFREALPSIILVGVFCLLAALVILGHVFKTRIDQHEMRHFLVVDSNITLSDIVDELDSFLQSKETVVGNNEDPSTAPSSDEASQRLFGNDKVKVCVQVLAAMAKRYSDTQAKKSRPKINTKERRKQQHLSKQDSINLTKAQDERLCFDAAMVVLTLYPDQDEAASSSLALLALVAKNDAVRSHFIKPTDISSDDKKHTSSKSSNDDKNNESKKNIKSATPLKTCIEAMKESLERTKRRTKPSSNNGEASKTQEDDDSGTDTATVIEQRAADLQRKGCLLLGALADDHPEVATNVVGDGGLEAILAAVDWFRLHEDVCNWGLWAIFVLCYSHMQNKHVLIQEGGLERVCRIMKDIPESMEVQRHGVAILFDVLREAPTQSSNVQGVAKVRLVALNAGLHEALVSGMTAHPFNIEIHMMSLQMLAATGFQGEVPEFKGKIPSATTSTSARASSVPLNNSLTVSRR
jgi:hypothetical protein